MGLIQYSPKFKVQISPMPRSSSKDSPAQPTPVHPGTFSERYQRAKQKVEQMERATQDLDQAMEAYRQAMEDLQWCREYLRNARLQVETLVNGST
jgi:exodeoxyribonuclease VII small subunit